MEYHPESEFGTGKPEPSSWSQDRRLKFIDFRLRWEGRVNRSDLISHFDISAVQASADFAKYTDAAPHNIGYDTKLKSYMRGETFAPLYPRSRSQLYLNELLALSTGILEKDISFIGWHPDVAAAPIPERTFDGNTLVTLVQAIRDKRCVSVAYQGMKHPEPTVRELVPHALAFDGMRWHARAYCYKRERYQDFVLGRMLQLTLGETRTPPLPDEEWNRSLVLVLAPNAALPAAAKRAIRLEYGMHDGFLHLSCRQALLYYALRRLRLEDPSNEQSPAQQITLVNRDELQPFIDQVDTKASDGTRPTI
jgi:hypothetical protein